MPPAGAPNAMTSNIGSGQPQVRKRNPGVVSLILGIVGFCGITAIIGLVFGIKALSESKQNEGKGKILAIAATVINALWLVFWLYFLVVGNTEAATL